MGVKRRPLAWRDHVLKGSQGAIRLLAANLEGERPPNWALDLRAVVRTDNNGPDRVGHMPSVISIGDDPNRLGAAHDRHPLIDTEPASGAHGILRSATGAFLSAVSENQRIDRNCRGVFDDVDGLVRAGWRRAQ